MAGVAGKWEKVRVSLYARVTREQSLTCGEAPFSSVREEIVLKIAWTPFSPPPYDCSLYARTVP
eukprot:6204256-Prymnesium_polylepis.1